MEQEVKIRSLIENWAKSIQDRDLAGAVAHHTNDIVMFDVPMPIQCKGIDAYKKTWELFFQNNSGGPDSFTITELEIVADENVAFANAIIDIFNSFVRLSLGLKKIDNEWLIAHEHHSYPLRD